MTFSVSLLLLVITYYNILRADGQQVSVSLVLRGQTILNNSLVNLDDLTYQSTNPGFTEVPTNANGLHTLMCVTDLVACCQTEGLGNWYYPDGSRVTGQGSPTFRTNRGQNEVLNNQQFYGSIRLWRYYTPPERGLFHCELPDANNVVQILYVNILFFTRITGSYNVSVAISPSGSTTAGETYSLTCSATLRSHNPPSPESYIMPPPDFEWFYGSNGNALLLSGLTPTVTVLTSGVYTSTLQFSPLSQSHTGDYTCRLGVGSLVNSAMVTVNAPTISAQITTSNSGTPMLGQNGYSLICNVSGAENLSPSITYQWTKNNGTQTQTIQVGGTDFRFLSFSPLRLSDAGQYTCQATISSPYLNNDIIVMNSQDIMLQIPASTTVTVMLSSSIPNPIPPFGSDVTLICTVLLTSGPEIDVPLNVNFELLRTDPGGSPLTITTPSVSGSSYTSTATISSFGRNDSGVYTCRASVSSASTNTYISDSNTESNSLRVATGVYLALRGVFIANNSNTNIRNIGQSHNGALQCITDRTPCCFSQDPKLGEWYLPNGQLVQGTTSTTAFYRNRGDNGEVSLNRPSDVESPIGLFCCELPDATNTNQTLCVNIGVVFITPSGSSVAGEMYTLECSVGGSMATFQWLGPPDGRTPVVSSDLVTISSTPTTSQLQFRPAQQSDNGSYSCSATVDGLTLSSESVFIVNAPSVSVQIRDGGATPTAGENYQLTCSTAGAGNLNPASTYLWMKNSGSDQTQVGTNSNTLSFTPLLLSDAANYVCTVTIASSYLTGDIVVMNAQDIRIQIPTQSSITLTSSTGDSGVQIVGSNVILTCTVELTSVIQSSEIFSLTVDAQLSRDGTLLTLAGPVVTGTTLTYTRRFEPFGRNDSGNYTCLATIGPQSSLIYLTGNETLQSDSVSIKAVSAPPLNVRATQSSSSAPVEVSWSPPTDGDAITIGYRIFYGNGQNILIQAVSSLNDVTLSLTVRLRVNEDYVGQNVSIRSETDQLYSELVNVTVSRPSDIIMAAGCSSEIGTTIGVIIVVECLVVTVITIIVILCFWRKKSSRSYKFAVSANMSYGQINLKLSERTERENENPDRSGEWTDTTTTATYETIDTRSNPMCPDHEYVYARADEAVRTISEQ